MKRGKKWLTSELQAALAYSKLSEPALALGQLMIDEFLSHDSFLTYQHRYY